MDYDQFMRIFQPDRYLLEQFVAEHAPRIVGTVLDVGGQDGKRYRSYFTQASTYITLDPDAAYAPTIIGKAEDIPLEDHSADAILCAEVLMYINHPEKAIREMARVLKPGGVLMLTTSFMSTPTNHPHYFWQIAPAGFRSLLTPYFAEIDVQNRGGFRCLRAQNWIRRSIQQHDLYHHRIIGGAYSILSSIRGRHAISRDDKEDANTFTMGFNVLARKNA